MADLKRLVAVINRDTRKSVENFISTEAQVSVEMWGWSPALRGEVPDVDLIRAKEILTAVICAIFDAGITQFEPIRAGLAAVYEGIVRPQGSSFQRAWKEFLRIQVEDPEASVPKAEKILARTLLAKVKERQREEMDFPEAKVVVHKGDYIAVYKGGKWAVGVK